MLKIERAVYAPPEMDIIIPLEDVFPPIAKSSIAQEKSQPAEFQIFLMVPGYAVGHERRANLVALAMPANARAIRAEGEGLIDFRVRERLVPSP